MRPFPEASVLATVPLKFAGDDLRLKTSHALFSGRHVDSGTMLLLKTLAQQKVIPDEGRALDAGCGYGPLALALKRHRPALKVFARDRLALAAAFTAENARVNRVEVDVATGLLLEDCPGPWDLIVSNIPAKAGDAVLSDFVVRSVSQLSDRGLVAVVIVETLAEKFSRWLDVSGAQRRFEEGGPGYRVFHYGAPKNASAPISDDFSLVYRRGQMTWQVRSRRFVQKTFYGLPNFDSLDYRMQITIPLLDTITLRGDVLVWEPVQGHLSTWADAVMSPDATLHLGANDRLGVWAASQNLSARPSIGHVVPFLGDLELGPGSLGAALVQFHPEPEVPWVDDARDTLLRLVAPGGLLVVNGSSTDLTRFLEKHKGFRIERDERSKGWRAALLVRQPSS